MRNELERVEGGHHTVALQGTRLQGIHVHLQSGDFLLRAAVTRIHVCGESVDQGIHALNLFRADHGGLRFVSVVRDLNWTLRLRPDFLGGRAPAHG